MYSQASCGEDGLPRLIVDGWSHAGDFVYPGIMFPRRRLHRLGRS